MTESKAPQPVQRPVKSNGFISDADPVKSYNAEKRELNRTERHFNVSIAGHIIGINTLQTDTYALCENYICDMKPEFSIVITQADIEYERKEAAAANAPQDVGSLEMMAVHRKISEMMLSFDTFLMHGAVVASGNCAYMFTAESGVGKTTHIRKWLEKIKEAFVVNGDKPLIKISEKQALACGTPWCGKEGWNANTAVPLKAIVLMERGNTNRIEEISFGNAFVPLLGQTYRPKDPEKMQKTLALLLQLKGKVRFFHFVFDNMQENAFQVAYRALTEDS